MSVFGEHGAYPELRIHRSALEHNLRQFKKLAPQSKILLPVKANAYGCGIETLFPFLTANPVDMLGVANISEAVQLRRLGWQKPILNLGGFFPGGVRGIVEHGITPSLTDLWQVAALDGTATRPVGIHIKLDRSTSTRSTSVRFPLPTTSSFARSISPTASTASLFG